MAFIETKVSKTYGKYGYFQNRCFNKRTIELILRAAELSGWGTVRFPQGGLSGGVAASAKTHFGLDIADIAIDGRSKAAVWKFCKYLMLCGGIPFPRGYTNDSFQNNKHIHLIAYNGSFAHQQAKDQVSDYKRGRDGLAYHRKYTGPTRQPIVFWSRCKYNPANATGKFYVDPKLIKPNSDSRLLGLNSDGKPVVSKSLQGYAQITVVKWVWSNKNKAGVTRKYGVTSGNIRYDVRYLNRGVSPQKVK